MAAGSIVIDLMLRSGSFETDTKRAEKRLSELRKEASASAKVLGAMAVTVGAAAFTSFIANTIAAQNEQAQLAAVLRSTGEAAGWSAAQLNEMALSMSRASTFSSGEITKAQTRLLSYTGIVGEQFPKAMQAVIDMAARMGMSLEQSAETIGRALDIPSQGLTALTRQGFRFTEAQKELVKQLEETGRVAEAQAIVLSALESSYGGAAAAARNTLGGALSALKNEVNNLMTGGEGSLSNLRNTFIDLANATAEFASQIDKLEGAVSGAFANNIAIGLARVVDVLFVIPNLLSAVSSSFRVVAADIKVLYKATEVSNPLANIASRLQGKNPVDELKKALEDRNRTLEDANKKYDNLWNQSANRFEQAFLSQVQFRAEYINKYTEKALAVQRAYINESIEVQQMAQRELAKNLGFNASQSMTAPATGEVVDKGAKKAKKAAEAAAEASKKFIESLQRQYEVLGLNEQQLMQYEAAHLKLSATQAQAADVLINKIALYKEEEQRLKDVTKALEEGQRLAESLRTPLEILNDEYARLEKLVNAGAISQETLERALTRAQSAYDETLESTKKYREEQERLNSLLAATPSAQLEKVRDDMRLLADSFLDGKINLEEYTEAANTALGRTAEVAEEAADQMSEFMKQAARNMQDAMADGFFNIMEGKFDNLVGDFTSMINRMVANLMASQLMTFLTGDFGSTGQMGGALGNLFGGIFGGAKASGGDVIAGRSYLVGERGPEMFTPRTTGAIMPSSKLSGGGAVSVYNNFTVSGTTDRRSQMEIAARVGESVNRAMQRNR